MTYDPSDDYPETLDYPSLPSHEPDVRPFPRIGFSPAEVTVTCSCGLWDFTSQESISGGVEPWGEYFEDHLTAVKLGEAA